MITRSRTILLGALPLLTIIGCEHLLAESPVTAAETLYGSVSTTTSYPAVGRVRVAGTGTCSDGTPECRECTAVLIHPQYILTTTRCGLSLNGSPVATPGDGDVVIFTSSTNQQQVIPIAQAAWLPSYEFAASGTTMTNTDLVVAKLASASTITPVSLMSYAPWGNSVTAIGYGKYDSGCASAPDGKKRSSTWTLNAGAYNSCNGDWGGPLLNTGTVDKGKLVALMSSPTRLVNTAWLHEEIYDQMLRNEHLYGTPPYEIGGMALANVNRVGPDLSTSSQSSATLCEQTCYKNNNCKAWTWNIGSHTCGLKKDVAAWSFDSNYTSGVRPVAQPGTTRWGTTQTIVATLPNTPGPETCALACAQNPNCKSFTHSVNGSTEGTRLFGTCTLSSSSLSASIDPTTVPLYPEGPNRPTATISKYFSGLRPTASVTSTTRNSAGSIKTTSPGSAEACATDCAKDYRCRAYKYSGSGTTCTLLDAPGTPTSSNGISAGVLRSVPLMGVAFNGFELPGKSWYDPTVSCQTGTCPVLAEQCRADCESEPLCVGYRIGHPGTTTTLKCTLFSAITEEFPMASWDGGLKGFAAF